MARIVDKRTDGTHAEIERSVIGASSWIEFFAKSHA